MIQLTDTELTAIVGGVDWWGVAEVGIGVALVGLAVAATGGTALFGLAAFTTCVGAGVGGYGMGEAMGP